MKFSTCEIYESDLIFAFNSTEYDVEKIEQNFNIFKSLYIKYRDETHGVSDLNISLVYIPRNGEFEFKEKLQGTDWSQFETILDFESNGVSSDKIKKGLEIYMGPEINYGYVFVVLDKDSDVVGLVSAFEEYSDWRGGLVWWVYDLKLKIGNVTKSDKDYLLRSFLVNISL
jgi:hypothetical protein